MILHLVENAVGEAQQEIVQLESDNKGCLAFWSVFPIKSRVEKAPWRRGAFKSTIAPCSQPASRAALTRRTWPGAAGTDVLSASEYIFVHGMCFQGSMVLGAA